MGISRDPTFAGSNATEAYEFFSRGKNPKNKSNAVVPQSDILRFVKEL